MDYRAKIKRLREERGWSQAEFGKRIGESQQTVSNIEKGRTEGLSRGKWMTIAEALGVLVSELLEDGKTNTPPGGEAVDEVLRSPEADRLREQLSENPEGLAYLLQVIDSGLLGTPEGRKALESLADLARRSKSERDQA